MSDTLVVIRPSDFCASATLAHAIEVSREYGTVVVGTTDVQLTKLATALGVTVVTPQTLHETVAREEGPAGRPYAYVVEAKPNGRPIHRSAFEDAVQYVKLVLDHAGIAEVTAYRRGAVRA